MNDIDFVGVYQRSVTLASELGFDFSDDGVSNIMQLPPLAEWEQDKKLKPFVSIRACLDERHQTLLDQAIKNLRSPAKGSIRGRLFEDAVERLAERYDCVVKRNVRVPDVAESIDCVIYLPNGAYFYVMCQMDLWNGGQQVNRAEKYLKESQTNFISLVYNPYEPPTKVTKNNVKKHQLDSWISKAYKERRLMWLSDLDDELRKRLAQSA